MRSYVRKKIREEVEAKGTSMSDWARRLGVSRQVLNLYLSGATDFPAWRQVHLSRLLDMSDEDLGKILRLEYSKQFCEEHASRGAKEPPRRAKKLPKALTIKSK